MSQFGTLQNLMLFFLSLYGQRNRVFLHSFKLRLDLLLIGMNDLRRALRKGEDKEYLGICLARLISRFICVAEQFHDPPLVEALCRKFPLHGCSYCNTMPCSCEEKRSDPALEKASAEQLGWSLEQFAKHLNNLYGAANQSKGLDYIYGRLTEEYAEIAEYEIGVHSRCETPDSIVLAICEEIADGIAWAIAIANALDINVEEIIWERYGEGCSHCHQNPCQCGPHNFLPLHQRS